MQSLRSKIASADWSSAATEMHDKGFAVVPGILTGEECERLKADYHNPAGYRKTVIMERHHYGKGEYRYFDYPLPALVQTIRTDIYPYLMPVANDWMKALNIDRRFPATHEALLQQCRDHGQSQATALILKYGRGGYNALHRDLYGDIYFPLQVALVLDEPGKDFTGGEFVLVRETPEGQSQAIVLNPGKGDMLIFTTSFYPLKSEAGYARAGMKHGVSEVCSGERHTLGIIFHDALS